MERGLMGISNIHQTMASISKTIPVVFRSRFLAAFLSCLITLLFFLSPSAAVKKKLPVGAVVAWTGDVYVYHEDGTEGVKVKGMEGIYPRDTIITSLKSKAKILMKDDSILSL